MRAVASWRSATTCVIAAGRTIQGDQSWRARTARFVARNPRACVRGASPVRTAMQSATYAARPLARATSQKKRSIYELAVFVTAVRVVVRTAEVSVVVLVAVEVAALVEPALAGVATTAGWSGGVGVEGWGRG